MASKFTPPVGVFKFGEIEFEWLPLLKTPCNGFNGPNACYSSSCKHEPMNTSKPFPKVRLQMQLATKPPYFALFKSKEQQQQRTHRSRLVENGIQHKNSSCSSSTTSIYSNTASNTPDERHSTYVRANSLEDSDQIYSR